jgi:hypothetical protein
MSRNINAQAVLLSNVAATDVAYLNGNLNVKGVGSIPVKKITSATRIGQASGSQIETNTITVGTATGSATYSGAITQVIEGATYTWPFSYVAPSGSPTAATIAAGITAKIQEGIDGNQILGTVSNPGGAPTTIAFVGTSVAPAAGVTVDSKMSNAKTYTSAWSAGAYTSSASVSSLAGFTNLVVGNLYRVNFGAGSTGADAAYFNLQTGFGLATSATAMTIFAGIPASVTITSTASTTSALAEPARSLESLMAGIDGYSATAPYVGYLIEFETSNGVEAGVVSPIAILFNASDTNALAFERALTAGFNGSSAFTSLNTLA